MNSLHKPYDRSEPVYTVTVYLAPPGTLRQVGDAQIPSTAGHMYYSISDGVTTRGYGFSPKETGIIGEGEIKLDEHDVYIDPAYALRLQVTREQYLKLRDYGESALDGKNPDFNLTYNGASNSCIDFTWGALNHAGLHARRQTLGLDPATGRLELRRSHEPATGFDGDVKVMDNKDDLRSIPPPFPGSRHNGEVEHPMPDRKDLKWYQPLITENHEVPASTPSLASLSARDQSLLGHLKERLGDAPGFDDARLAQTLCRLKQAGIFQPGQLHGKVHLTEDAAYFRHATSLSLVQVDLKQPAPALEASLQASQEIDRQHARQQEQVEQQRLHNPHTRTLG